MAGRIKIRLAHPDERELVLNLLRKLHAELRQFGGRILSGKKTDTWIEYLFDEATSGRGLCFVVADNGGIVGVSLAVEQELPYETDLEDPLFGFGTYILPNYREKGLAQELYQKMITEAKARGYTYVGAYLVENTPIKKLLSKFGVREVETMIVFE